MSGLIPPAILPGTTAVALSVSMGLLLVAVIAWVGHVEQGRSSVPAIDSGAGTDQAGTDRTEYVHEEKPGGLTRWLTTVDHKDIGLLYGTYALITFVWGGLSVLVMRTELLDPPATLIQPRMYNALLTSHGLTMLLLFATPILAAFGNYFVPLLIGADDMAFPRINAIAFWLLPPGALLVWAGFFIPGIAPSQTSWTMYTPLSIQQPSPAVDLMLLGLHLTGVSATMSAINFIATIAAERAEDVTWANLDIFSWTMLTQAGLILFSFPLLGSALIMLLLDRNFGTTFFLVEGGGPLLWQNLFWFFGHPEVYIIVLPPMGLVSYILPKFAGRKLFGFRFVVYSTLAIGVLSFGVWAHHMFATGIDPRIRLSFMVVTLAIAVPSAVKTFNWIATLWNGDLRLTAPMLFCLGFVSNFVIGGVTGVFLASIPIDLILTDTYYVVGHFHYILMAILAAVFAGIYYWFPLYTGRMYQRTLARAQFWLFMAGSNLTFFALLLLGYAGMPRRYATYALGEVGPIALFTALQQVATLGAFLIGFSGLVFLWNVVQSWQEGPHIDEGDPWDLTEAGQLTKEWEWFERERVGPITDGGTDQDQPPATDDAERSP